MNDAKYIGLDVHQAAISVAVRDAAGKLVMDAILETRAEMILQFLGGLRGRIRGPVQKQQVLVIQENLFGAEVHRISDPSADRPVEDRSARSM
jgi:hypothetical protein